MFEKEPPLEKKRATRQTVSSAKCQGNGAVQSIMILST